MLFVSLGVVGTGTDNITSALDLLGAYSSCDTTQFTIRKLK